MIRSPIPTRQITFDTYLDPPSRSQDESFVAVQRSLAARDPEHVAALQRIVLRLAAQRGDRGFTSDDVRDEPGWEEVASVTRIKARRNLPGIVIGSLRSHHSLCVMGREKSRRPEGRGRWVNRYKINAGAIVAQSGAK